MSRGLVKSELAVRASLLGDPDDTEPLSPSASAQLQSTPRAEPRWKSGLSCLISKMVFPEPITHYFRNDHTTSLQLFYFLQLLCHRSSQQIIRANLTFRWTTYPICPKSSDLRHLFKMKFPHILAQCRIFSVLELMRSGRNHLPNPNHSSFQFLTGASLPCHYLILASCLSEVQLQHPRS